MAKILRNIVKIDEDKCNGCGICIPACKEGAIQIIDGKAKLVSEIYCDGLGACLGKCPLNAITIVKRKAEDFNEEAAMKHVEEVKKPSLPCGCPGMTSKKIERREKTPADSTEQASQLSQWPIQLTLIPANAPYLKNADLILLADCTAVAYANLHRDFLKDHIVAMACPKLDETDLYIEKLAKMIKLNDFSSIEVVMMEVPCCRGLSQIMDTAVNSANANLDIKKTIIGIEGNRL